MLRSIQRAVTIILNTCGLVLFFPAISFISTFRDMTLPPAASWAMAQPAEVAFASVALLTICVVATPIGFGALVGCNVASMLRRCFEPEDFLRRFRVLYVGLCLGWSGFMELVIRRVVSIEELASFHAVAFVLYLVLSC